MIYQILQPFAYTIDANSFHEAIKNFVKINKAISINSMIITDQQKHMKANMNYYKHDGRNKVGINMFPISPYGLPVVSMNETYIPPRVVLGNVLVAPVMQIPKYIV